MKKISLVIFIVAAAVILIGSVASALPNVSGRDVARQKSPAVDEAAGNVIAPPQLSENELTKIVFIRQAPGFAKDRPCNNNGICDAGEKGWCSDCKNGGEEPPAAACYGFLAGSKPHWNWLEDYYSSDLALGTSAASAASTWETPVSGSIFGSGLSGTYPWGVYDLKNALSYGDYDDTGQCPTSAPCVIAVTAVWYKGKNIYEYDILFDTDYFPGSGIDLDTVVLHELGHGTGLDDLYDTNCASEVMYGIYDGPDLDLGPGDVQGIQTLYGAQ